MMMSISFLPAGVGRRAGAGLYYYTSYLVYYSQ